MSEEQIDKKKLDELVGTIKNTIETKRNWMSGFAEMNSAFSATDEQIKTYRTVIEFINKIFNTNYKAE